MIYLHKIFSVLLEDAEVGFPSECQFVEAANGNLVLVSPSQYGEPKLKKAFSNNGGESWSALDADSTLPSVACMGSIIKGPNGSWGLYASAI